MRTHIGYGIYFNNDFCQIARMENGMPVIKKSDTMKEAMPLCVAINQRQNILVGDTAYNVLKSDNQRALKNFEKGKSNAFIGFTRTLGTDNTYESSNAGKCFSSEDLLAECFKKLKSFVTDEEIHSIVITVPDKFLNPQYEAVIKAGQLAGFKQVHLVQETIAVTLAYPIIDGCIVTFDFGKSEFKTSLCKVESSTISIIDTDEDSWLGGKSLEEAIIDQIIIPNLQENYDIDDILNDSNKKEILRNALKPFAEVAKKRLSFKVRHNILSNLGDLPFEDDNGDEPEIDVMIDQEKIYSAYKSIFQLAINITLDLLNRNSIGHSEVASICLVGGDTYSPILRQMLKEQITKNVDTSVDPMTVVARGAALFASTISVSDEVKEATRDKTKVQLEINYEATSVHLDEMINLKVLKDKTEGQIPDKIYADVVRGDGAWSSGKKLIGEKATILDVLLVEGKSNAFEINVYDETGNKLDCQPNQFTIIQGIGGLDKMQVLPYHIGIGKWFESEGKELFMPIKGLEKNKQLPAFGVINGFRTPFDIPSGKSDKIIRLSIYQGDYNAEGTDVSLNNYCFDVIISGETLPKLLPKGSFVNITIRVDGSSLMKVSAEFPTIGHQEELEVEIQSTEQITSKQIDKLKGNLVLFYADNPTMGKEIFRFLLGELIRVEKENIGQDERLKVVEQVKRELRKWQ